jgi:hypothetical protein
MIDPAPSFDAPPLFAKAPSVATGAGVKIALLTPVVVTVLIAVAAAADVLDAVVVTVLLSVTSPADVLDAVVVTVLLSVTSPPDVLEAVVVTVLFPVISPPDVLDAVVVTVLISVTSPPDVLDPWLVCEPCEFDEPDPVELAPPPIMTPVPVVIVETEVDVTSVVDLVGEEPPDGVDEIPIRVSVKRVVVAAADAVLLGIVEVKICVAVSRVVDVLCSTTGPIAPVFEDVAELESETEFVPEYSVTVGTETVATGVTSAAVDMWEIAVNAVTVTVVSYDIDAMTPEAEPELAPAVTLLTAVEHVLPKVQMALERTERAFVVMVVVRVCAATSPDNVDEVDAACMLLVDET